MKLKRYGFFKELEHGDPDGDSLTALCGKGGYNERQKKRVVEYLENGHVFIGCPGTVSDALELSDGTPICSPSILTDGVWAWPADLAYYVSKYNIPVPDEMVKLMESQGWALSDEIEFTQLEL